MANYQDTYIHRDIAALFPNRNQVNFRRFISMLGCLSGQVLNRSDVARALEIGDPTVAQYLTIAEGTFLWRQLTSYENNITKSVVKMPKGHLRDTGLLHYLLRLNEHSVLMSDPIVRKSFESFVIEELMKGLQDAGVVNVDAHYYRTYKGAEIDLILQGSFGTLPIEIKYGSTVQRRQLRSLQSFVEAHQLPFGVLINQAEQVKWLTERIIQIPAGLL